MRGGSPSARAPQRQRHRAIALSTQIVYRHGFIQMNPAVGAEVNLSSTKAKRHWHRYALTKGSTTLWAADKLDGKYRAREADNGDDGENGQLVTAKSHWTENCNQQPATDPDAHGPSDPTFAVVANCHTCGVYRNPIRPNWDALHARHARPAYGNHACNVGRHGVFRGVRCRFLSRGAWKSQPFLQEIRFLMEQPRVISRIAA
jgi:hypothetical protein